MNSYLVGGAVRDMIQNNLAMPHGYCNLSVPDDLDFVIVGATVDQCNEVFGSTIGQDFPVWLDKDKNQWALARTERNIGVGHTAFEVETNNVTIEDDLYRRDFTFNAMAMPMRGEIGDSSSVSANAFSFVSFVSGSHTPPVELIDPYGGFSDLVNGVIRHVSDAFDEDPLRVLRCARFYAKFYNNGFTVHPDTIQKCRDIVASGKMSSLSGERIWAETEKALKTQDPDRYFCFLKHVGFFNIIEDLHISYLNMKSARNRVSLGEFETQSDFSMNAFLMTVYDQEEVYKTFHVPAHIVKTAEAVWDLLVRSRNMVTFMAYMEKLQAFGSGSNRVRSYARLIEINRRDIAQLIRKVLLICEGIKGNKELTGKEYGDSLRLNRLNAVKSNLKDFV